MSNFQTLFAARAEKLVFYTPCYFIREITAAKQLQSSVYQPLYLFGQDPHQQIITITASSETHFFYVSYLPWDSDFFQRPVYRLFTVLYKHQNYLILKKAILYFIEQFMVASNQYCFIEIPAEDTLLMQALHANGFITVETRLAFFRKVADFSYERYAVKKATTADIEAIRKVAAHIRNPYDRFHAEPVFTQPLADAFLAKYAEEAANGYCDVMLVPAENDVPAEAFLALNYLPDYSQLFNCSIAKIVLTAVGPTCKGWQIKLMSESIHLAQATGVKYIWITTQVTNAAIIRNCEKLKFSMGGARHILSYSTGV